MKNPSFTVGTLLPQHPGTALTVEAHTQIHQLHNPGRPLSNQDLYNIRITKVSPGTQGILQMQKRRVISIDSSSNPSLCLFSVAVMCPLLRDEQHRSILFCPMSCHKTGNSAPYNQKISFQGGQIKSIPFSR